MEWKSILLGVGIGVLLMPVLFLVGLRLFLWLVARKLRSVVKKIEEQGGAGGFQVHTATWSNVPITPQPALIEPRSLEQQLEEGFLAKTSLSAEEWDEIRQRVVFVHDDLSESDLRQLGFSDMAATGSARQRVKGMATFLGSLQQPVEADVYVMNEESCPTAAESN
jgi:hypothetical protein